MTKWYAETIPHIHDIRTNYQKYQRVPTFIIVYEIDQSISIYDEFVNRYTLQAREFHLKWDVSGWDIYIWKILKRVPFQKMKKTIKENG